MVKSTKLDDLLKKELTRKQFIQVMFVGVASLLGFSNFLRLFSRFDQTQSSDKASSGFGNNKFGV